MHICPSCHHYTKHVHDYRQQKIQHINIGKTVSFIFLKKRRYICNHCGKKFYEHYDFLQKYFRKSNEVFENVCHDLKQLKNFKTIANDNHISIPTVVRYMHYYILLSGKFNRPLPKRIGIDEFKGNTGKEKYQCILTNPETGEVLDILPERYSSYLGKYMRKYTLEERRSVKYFISDMWSPYTDMATTYFPEATQIVDKYHFIRQIIWAFERVRKSEQKKYGKENRLLFKNSKRILTKRASKLNDEQKQRVNAILYISDALREAYILKEEFYRVCDCTDRANTKVMMEEWIYTVQKCDLKDYHYCANTLLNWQKGILNSFDAPYTNGFTEGCNNKIKVLKRNAYGYRNFERFRKRILHMFRYKSEKAKTNAAA